IPDRMLGHQVAATGLAELPEALLGLVIDADVVLAFREAHRVGLPEAECVDRPRGPRAARVAMTVALGDRLSGHAEADGSAEAASLMRSLTHDFSCSRGNSRCIPK